MTITAKEYSPLNPPVNIDGVDFSMAVKFDGVIPSDYSGNRHVVSGTLAQDPVDLGDNTYRLVFSRQQLTDYYVVSAGIGNVFSVPFNFLAGGNICTTTECQRFYSRSGTPYRGSDTHEKALIGDCAHTEDDSASWTIVDAPAFSVAPNTVSWQSGDPVPDTRLIDIADFTDDEETGRRVYALTIDASQGFEEEDAINNPNREVVFDFEGNNFQLADSGLYRLDSGTPTLLTYQSFTNDIYPDDATFATGDYWFDSFTYRFRIALSAFINATDDFAAIYYIQGLGSFTYDGVEPLVMSGEGAGTGSTEDSGFFVGMPLLGNAHTSIILLNGQPDTNGDCSEGALEWRQNTTEGAIRYSIEFSNGNLTRVSARTTTDDPEVEVWTGSTSLGGGILKINRTQLTNTTSNFEVELNGSILSGTSYTMPINDDMGGLYGILTYGTSVKCNGLTGEVISNHIGTGSDGNLAKRTYVTDALTGVHSVSAPEAPSSVELNYSPAVACVNTTTAARNHYQYIAADGKIYFPSETAGDIVKITFATTSVYSGSAPGLAPRADGTVNFATRIPLDLTTNPSKLPLSSSNVSENVGHYHDSITVVDSHGDLPTLLSAGSIVAIKRDTVFDPLKSYTVSTCAKGEQWQALSSAQYYIFHSEGVILIAKSITDSLDTGETLCVKVQGKVFEQSGGMEAKQFNQIGQAIESLENAWFSLSLSANDGAYNINGDAFLQIMATEWDTNGSGGLYVSEKEWAGKPKKVDNQIYPVSGYYKNYDYGGTEFIDCPANANPFQNIDYYYAGNWTNGDFMVGAAGQPTVGVFPYGSNLYGAGNNAIFWGSDHDISDSLLTATYQFTPYSLGAGNLARFPSGTTCVVAKCEVQSSALYHTTWAFSRTESNDPDNENYWVNDYRMRNGQTVNYFGPGHGQFDFGDGPPPDSPTGTIGFSLVGVRKNSNNITDIFGNPVDQREQILAGLGSTVQSPITSGRKAIVDMTGVVNALLTDLDNPDSHNNSYALVPSVGQSLMSNGNAGGCVAFALGQYGSFSSSYSINPTNGRYTLTRSASGSAHHASSISLSRIYARFRLPDGSVTDTIAVCPTNAAPAMRLP